MPQPEVRKSSDGRWAVRDSPDGQWMILPHPPEGYNDGGNPASNRPLDSNGIKQIMTFLGATAAPLIAPEGVLPALTAATIGGAGGRVLGGAAQALTSKNGGNLTDDLETGALEGFSQEALPAGVGLAARGAGMATDLLPPRLKGWTVPKAVDSIENALSRTPVNTTSQWLRKGFDAAKDGLAGLKDSLFPTEPPNSVLSGVTLTPEAVGRNVAATNLRDVEGFSHAQAGKLEGIPGAGQSKRLTNISHLSQIPEKSPADVVNELSPWKHNDWPNMYDGPDPAEEVGRSVLSSGGGGSSLDGLKIAVDPKSLDPNMNAGAGDPLLAGSYVQPKNSSPKWDLDPKLDPLKWAAFSRAVNKP